MGLEKEILHLTPIRMATIKKKKTQVLVRMWRNWNFVPCWWECKMVQLLENGMEVPQSNVELIQQFYFWEHTQKHRKQ